MQLNSDITDRWLYLSGGLSSTIERLLTEKNITREDVAVKLGLSVAQTRKFTSLCHNFTLEEIVRLEEVLGTKLIKLSE